MRELDDLVRRAREVLDRDGSEKKAEKAFDDMHLTVMRGFEGRVLIEGELPAEEGEYLMEAINRMLAAERRSPQPVDAAASTGQTAQRAPLGHRKAQALLALVQAGADNEAFAYPTRGRAEVLVVVDYDTLVTGGAGQAELFSGGALTSEAVRRLCCDAGIRRVVTKGGSQVLDLGRLTRIATPAQRAAAWVRDRGCRFPECGRRWGLEVHQLVEFNGPEQGETNLEDLAWFCWDHHHACHEGGWVVTGNANGTLTFHGPTGGVTLTSMPYPERLTA